MRKFMGHTLGIIITAAQLSGGYAAYVRGVTVIDQCPDAAVYAMLEEEQERYGAEVTILFSSAACNQPGGALHTGGVIGDGAWSIDTNGTVGVHVDLQ